MEHTWKSHLNRRTMAYLHPNPFYHGVARMLLLEQEVRGEIGEGFLLFDRCVHRLSDECFPPPSHTSENELFIMLETTF